tara:strand:+ start:630 stop:857 length:228 start_codon:yes stop_codon:yes gene_type:complete
MKLEPKKQLIKKLSGSSICLVIDCYDLGYNGADLCEHHLDIWKHSPQNKFSCLTDIQDEFDKFVTQCTGKKGKIE